MNGRISSNIAEGKIVITGCVFAGIEYMHKELKFRMNRLFLSILHGMPKRLPKMLFVFSIMHGSRAGNMGSETISAVDIVAFGDAPDWVNSAMT